MRSVKRARGFTLLELLIVVAIIGILGAVAIVAYRKYVAHARKSEVFAMIAAIKSAEDAYKAESSAFISSGISETDYYPTLGADGTEPKLKSFDPNAAGKVNWQALGISPPASALYCGYVVIAGNAGVAPSGARGNTLFNGKTPTRPWYYVRAECDFDGKSSVNSTFETTHDSEIVYIDNEGK